MRSSPPIISGFCLSSLVHVSSLSSLSPHPILIQLLRVAPIIATPARPRGARAARTVPEIAVAAVELRGRAAPRLRARLTHGKEQVADFVGESVGLVRRVLDASSVRPLPVPRPCLQGLWHPPVETDHRRAPPAAGTPCSRAGGGSRRDAPWYQPARGLQCSRAPGPQVEEVGGAASASLQPGRSPHRRT